MVKQLKINLNEDQSRRLCELANKQCRQPHEQARYILLSNLGMLETLPPIFETIQKANSDTTRQGNSVAVLA